MYKFCTVVQLYMYMNIYIYIKRPCFCPVYMSKLGMWVGGPEPEPIRLCIMVVGGTVGWGGPTPIRLVIKCLCKLIRFDMEAYVDQLLDACMLHIFLPLIIHIANF